MFTTIRMNWNVIIFISSIENIKINHMNFLIQSQNQRFFFIKKIRQINQIKCNLFEKWIKILRIIKMKLNIDVYLIEFGFFTFNLTLNFTNQDVVANWAYIFAFEDY